MEKGFNDEELADIMSEIESLEKEFAEETSTKPAEASSAVVHELAQRPLKETVLKTNHTETQASAPASLSFKVQGQMTMQLNFEVNGQTVALSVTEQGLSIQTESGATFSLPLAKEAHKKVA
jgi:uncharacterized protein YkuJ